MPVKMHRQLVFTIVRAFLHEKNMAILMDNYCYFYWHIVESKSSSSSLSNFFSACYKNAGTLQLPVVKISVKGKIKNK